MRVTALARYPVKSCRGEALQTALVRPWGLAGDRRWMLVDDAGRVVSARQEPALLLVTPRLTPALNRQHRSRHRSQHRLDPAVGRDDGDSDGGRAGLVLNAPGQPELTLIEPGGAGPVSVRVWDDDVRAAPATPAADAWFSAYLGTSVRLVFLDDPRGRPVDPRYGRPGDVVSFADAYPLLLTTTDSLDALNDLVWTGSWADEAPLVMTRFRPSVVVSGSPAWAEDEWKRIRIGSVEFRAARGCARCVITTVDPDTGEKGREPLATLARHRNWDGKLWFGVNLIPEITGGRDVADTDDRDGPAPALHIGDAVEVLD
jgi:uncharacterized protein